MIKCEKYGCIANFDGECVLDECKGEIIQFPSCRAKDKEARRQFYEYTRDTFSRDFPNTDIREQMRREGVSKEDIELALSTIEELSNKKGGDYNGSL